ncbi:DUF1439 domain-containing protein [Ferrimonas marina]|uniref:DUF1439 domain-containing protein n=1 Tax=Ferrimonas marina TaxID=299255 RepID=A0A1M5XHB3_9GAMM|nr:DUF1439 domain-containing protein [Ferrimonas marina]SHH99166.1 Protein of unknown function [Ferrimonas marina]
MRLAVWAILVGLLGGCAASYSVTESELEGYLNRQLKQEHQSREGPLGAKMVLSDMQVTIGQQPDKVAISARSEMALTTPIFPLRANLDLTFSATPWYNPDDHSIYLKHLELDEVRATPKEIEQVLIPFSREAMQFISLFLQNQPIYTLDDKGWQQDLLRQFGKEIQVKPGKLTFVLQP